MKKYIGISFLIGSFISLIFTCILWTATNYSVIDNVIIGLLVLMFTWYVSSSIVFTTIFIFQKVISWIRRLFK